MTVVDRGMMVVSSSYSNVLLLALCFQSKDAYKPRLTFFTVIGVDGKIEVSTITEATLDDYVTLKLKDRYAGAVELDPSRLLLRLELEENGGRHIAGVS